MSVSPYILGGMMRNNKDNNLPGEKKKFPDKPIKKMADEIVDKSYHQSKNKNPFTQIAENAKDLLSYKMQDGHLENQDGQRIDTVKEAIANNEALDKNFQDHKEDDYIKKLDHWGIEESSKKHPDYPKVSNQPILANNKNLTPQERRKNLYNKKYGISEQYDIKKNNPTLNKYKEFKENRKKQLEEKKFNQNFEREYGEKAIEKYVRSKVHKNRQLGKADYEDLPTSYLIVGEAAKDKAKKNLKTLQKNSTLNSDVRNIAQQISELKSLKEDFIKSKLKFEEAIKKPIDEDIYKGLGVFDHRWKK
mgnify:CR=1 FL=1